MNKVFVTGDLHGDAISRFSYSKNPPLRETIQEGDIVVCLGDCGIVDWPGFEKQCNYMLDWLNDKPQTTILLYGNHDNYDAIQKYPVIKKYGGYVRQVRDKVFAVDFPTVLDLNDNKCLLIPGADSHDIWNLFYPWQKDEIRKCRTNRKWYRVVGQSWWPQEKVNEPACSTLLGIYSRYVNDYDSDKRKFDYVLTHDCPDFLFKIWNSQDRRVPTEGEEFLGYLATCLSYKGWWHGHCHEELFAYGDEDFKTTHRQPTKPHNIACIYHNIYEIDSLYKLKQNKSF